MSVLESFQNNNFQILQLFGEGRRQYGAGRHGNKEIYRLSTKLDISETDDTKRSHVTNCTKAAAKQKLLKLFQKFIFFRIFSKPTALIIRLQKSELSGKVRGRAGFETRIIFCPGRCF